MHAGAAVLGRSDPRAWQAQRSSSVYLEYYGLKEPPFDITPNPRFLFYTAKHREAFNHMLYGIRERKGFVQLTGEVGAGKTTLCRAVLEELGDQYETALILNPVLNTDQLIKAIALEFGLSVDGLDRLETVAALNDFLLRQVDQHRDVVLIIDEAQNLELSTLKVILTRMSRDSKVVFCGDLSQVDNPYISPFGGMAALIEKFKGSPLFGHITLERSVRSQLAEMAASVV